MLLACLGAGFTTLLDSAVLSITLPSLRVALGASAGLSQWILASYSLTFGLALVPAGRLGDLYGRRRPFIAGVALFTTMSLLSGSAWTPWMVVIARLLQGGGAGVISAQVLGLVQDTFVGSARSRALGYYSVVSGVAGTLGPLVAGLGLTVLGRGSGWRLALLANIPAAVATLVIALRWLPDDRASARSSGSARSVDGVGLGLLGVATLAALAPFAWRGASAPSPRLLIPVALGAAVAFVAWERGRERRGHSVLIPALLARTRSFSIGTLVAMCWFAAGVGQSTVISLHLIVGLGRPPLVAAALLIGGSLAMSLAGLHSWRFLRRFGRTGVTAALTGQSVVLMITIALADHLGTVALVAVLMAAQTLAGTTNGLSEAPNRTLTLASVPAESAGVAAGVLQLSQRLAATICLAAVTRRSFDRPAAGAIRSTSSLRYGLSVCAVLLLAASALSAMDRRPRRAPTV